MHSQKFNFAIDLQIVALNLRIAGILDYSYRAYIIVKIEFPIPGTLKNSPGGDNVRYRRTELAEHRSKDERNREQRRRLRRQYEKP